MSVPNKTYNNVVNTLLRMAEFHRQIQTTSVGDLFSINLEKMQKFPLFHLNPTSVQTGDTTLTYNFQIFIMDMTGQKSDWTENRANLIGDATETDNGQGFTKLYKTLGDEQSVFNETLQIATDIIGMMRHSKYQSLNATPAFEPAGYNDINNPVYFTQDQFSIEPFQERFDNLLCGWVFNLGVLVTNDFNACWPDIPVDENKGAGF